jgi:hypothetical protein
MTPGKHRDSTVQSKAIAFSMSYQRDEFLARGLGFEHLRELVLRIARPLIRSEASLVYGGNWDPHPENLTFLVLRLISSELEDSSIGGPDTSFMVRRMYSYAAWPHSLQVTTSVEAQWINCCQIARISQHTAGLAPGDIVEDGADPDSDRYVFNRAVCLSAMRRLATQGVSLAVPDAPPDTTPPIAARIILGGKLTGFHGFLPGVLEEALLSFEAGIPTYVLGGFGGAAGVLAAALCDRPAPQLAYDWLAQRVPEIARLEQLASSLALPPGIERAPQLLARLAERARSPSTCGTGLSDGETRELATTCDIDRAVVLVRRGLQARLGLSVKPA